MRTWTILGMLALSAMASGCGDEPAGVKKLEYTDLAVGTGAEALTTSQVTIDYTAWLHDASGSDFKGKQVDTSIGVRPLQFLLGGGQIIKGLEQGVVGMKVGGQRRLFIPPNLAYGAQGVADVIPPNAALVFDVALLEVV